MIGKAIAFCLALAVVMIGFGISAFVADYILPKIKFVREWEDSLVDYDDDEELDRFYREQFSKKWRKR